MRGWPLGLILLAHAGCGRLGFDPLGGGSDAALDGDSGVATHKGWTRIYAVGPTVDDRGFVASAPLVIIGWKPISGAGPVTGWVVYRATSPGGQNFDVPIAVIDGSDTFEYTDTAVSAGTRYHYVVRPVIAGLATPTQGPDVELRVIVPPENIVAE